MKWKKYFKFVECMLCILGYCILVYVYFEKLERNYDLFFWLKDLYVLFRIVKLSLIKYLLIFYMGNIEFM